jgi:hypothetical protein
MKKRYYLVIVLVALLLLVLLYQRACTSRKIAEATFYKDRFVELKVVLRFENLPLHYQGEVTSVACRSSGTRGFPPWKRDFVEAGWNIAPLAPMRFGSGTLTKSIGEWARAAKDAYRVTDQMTVVIPRYTDLWITWNGCLSFVRWDVKADFPQDSVVDTNPAYEACLAMFAKQKAQGTPMAGDCYYSRWSRNDPLEFSGVVAKRNGSASFRVRSNAFRSDQAYTVSTDTFGKEWRTASP